MSLPVDHAVPVALMPCSALVCPFSRGDGSGSDWGLPAHFFAPLHRDWMDGLTHSALADRPMLH